LSLEERHLCRVSKDAGSAVTIVAPPHDRSAIPIPYPRGHALVVIGLDA